MLEMEIYIYPPLLMGGYDDEPMECFVTGKDNETTIEDLKNDLDETVISTLETYDYGSGTYLVEISFTDNNRYIGSEESVEARCNTETGTVTWL
jgi:hypothetical protein